MAESKKAPAVTETSEAQIAAHWKEEDYYRPPVTFVAQANLADPDINERFAEKNFPKCYEEYAELLTWYERWHTVLDTEDPPFWKWFVGGKINASYNCVDRHLAKYKNKAAIIFVPEPEDEDPTALTYQELYARVNEFAALLRDFAGLKTGDRVTIHMPMVAELPITMLACARLGVIHSVVFGGFSGHACGQRRNRAIHLVHRPRLADRAAHVHHAVGDSVDAGIVRADVRNRLCRLARPLGARHGMAAWMARPAAKGTGPPRGDRERRDRVGVDPVRISFRVEGLFD